MMPSFTERWSSRFVQRPPVLSVCSHPFTPTKLCAAVEEAKVHAAEHTLQTLCLQTEGAADAGCTTAAAVASVAFPGMWRSVPA